MALMVADRDAQLAGHRLEDVRLDEVIVLGFSGGRRVVIASTARLAGPHGWAEVEPGAPAADVLALLLGDVVRESRVSAAGELHLCFGSGSELVVGTDAEAESWAVAGPDGVLMVCLARGELAFWGGRD